MLCKPEEIGTGEGQALPYSMYITDKGFQRHLSLIQDQTHIQQEIGAEPAADGEGSDHLAGGFVAQIVFGVAPVLAKGLAHTGLAKLSDSVLEGGDAGEDYLIGNDEIVGIGGNLGIRADHIERGAEREEAFL